MRWTPAARMRSQFAETMIAPTTVSRVKRFLSFGAGGYRTAIARLEEKGLL